MSITGESDNQASGEGLSLNFTERLNDLLGRPLTSNNINTYFDEALLGLQSILEDLRNYHQESGHEDGFGAPFEDTIFQQYVGCTVGDVLELISRKGEYVRRAQGLVANAGGYDGVILPPDKQPVEISVGESDFEHARKEDRTVEVLYRLLDSGIDIENIRITVGEVDKNMFRKSSYVSLEIPELERLVLVCDEVGNATFVFDNKILESVGLPIEQVLDKTKEELGELIRENKSIGTRLINKGNWSTKLMGLLTGEIEINEDITTEQSNSYHFDTLDLPVVEGSEIHPWRGFYIDTTTGEHIGTIHVLADKVGWDDKTVKKKIILRRIKAIPIRDAKGHQRDGYSLELLNKLFDTQHDAPRVETSGEFKGFYFDADTNVHIGTLHSIAGRLKTNVANIRQIIESSELEPSLIRVASGDIKSGYSVEAIVELFQESPELCVPSVTVEGEHRGQYLDQDTGVNISSIDTISEQLNVSRERVNKVISEMGINAKKIFGLSGKIINGYPLESIRESLKDYLKLPVVDQFGDSKGFYFDHEKGVHIGTMYAISSRTGVAHITIRKLVELNELKGTPIREIGDREGVGYTLEQVEQLVFLLSNSPIVETNGENVGFYTDPNGQQIGAIFNLASLLGVDKRKIKKIIEDQRLEGVWIRDQARKLVIGYPLQEVRNSLNNYLELPQVEKEGEYTGFYFDLKANSYFGAIKTIAKKLGVSPSKINSILNEYQIERIEVRDVVGKQLYGYDLDRITELLQDPLQPPSVSKVGEYNGFYHSPDGQYFGTVYAITSFLDIPSSKVKKVVREHKIGGVRIRSSSGVVKIGYPLKEIENLLKSEKKEE